MLGRAGKTPLPPYIHRDRNAPAAQDAADRQRYQTVYANRAGAVAAPTAGLHFTPELLCTCAERSIRHTFVTLHVGLGTFRPIAVENLDEHRMHSEWCRLSEETAKKINQARAESGRVVAIGTTSVRTLETAARDGSLQAWQGEPNLFIRPPYEFQAVDVLLTNFHLPRSSLLVLVSAFAGNELIKKAYAAAIEEKYRFYSYGDAMLIV